GFNWHRGCLTTGRNGKAPCGDLQTNQVSSNRGDAMRKESRWSRYAAMIPLTVALTATGAFAQDEGPSVELFTVNNLWMMIAAALVFLMHLGFATLESGLTRAKNTTNVL